MNCIQNCSIDGAASVLTEGYWQFQVKQANYELVLTLDILI